MKGKNGKKVVKSSTTKKSDKRNLIIGIAMMVFAVAISVGTYAYYQTTLTGTVSGTILAWDCKDGNLSVGTSSLGNLKPGTSGSFTFSIKSTNFKTDQSISLKYANTDNVPAAFKLTKDSAHSTTIAMTSAYPSTPQISATNVAKSSTATTYTVYWEWPYGTSAETPLSTTSNVTLQIDYQIVCKQSATQ